MSSFRITTLVENCAAMPYIKAEHGFSVFVESENLNLLFDTGASKMFYQNSRKLELELYGADIIVLSHGHYDHSDGLSKALLEAPRASLWLHPEALAERFSNSRGKAHYIGISDTVKKNIRAADALGKVRWVPEDVVEPAKGIKLFNSGGRKNIPANWPFFLGHDCHGEELIDHFIDEISVLLEGDQEALLITGCSHCGIENIYQKATTISNVPVSHVLGGSHLNKASDEQIETVADFFREENVELYLGHCTGISGYSRLFRLLGDQLKPIYSGCKLEFDL